MGSRANPPTLDEASAAAVEILKRRRDHSPEDPDVWRLNNVEDLAEIAEYARIYRRVRPDTLAEDALDAVVIAGYLRAEAERGESDAIDFARAQGWSWSEISQRLHLSKQGAQQRRLRAEAQVGEPRDEKVIRAAKRAIIRQREADDEADDQFTALLKRLVLALEGSPDLPDDEDVRDYLASLRQDLTRQAQGSVLAAGARLVVGALAPYPVPDGCADLIVAVTAQLRTQRTS